jgi:hypothetical protein
MIKAEFIVLMFGARRTGKTSLLASMLNNYQETMSGSDVTFVPKNHEVFRILDKKQLELRNVFNSKKIEERWKIEESPTYEISQYSFKMNIIKSPNEYTVTFVDIPGEYIHDSHAEEVQEWLLKSDMVIIAIDTPHLIEIKGSYNEAFNRTGTLYNMFVNCSQFCDSDKLILFAPLKCEKYYYENRMEEVKSGVKSKYATIIRHFGNEHLKSKITMAITPILTMGGVVFSHLGRDENGTVEVYRSTDSQNLRPRHVYYKLRDREAQFSPKYCEQPLVYIMSFVSKIVKSKK